MMEGGTEWGRFALMERLGGAWLCRRRQTWLSQRWLDIVAVKLENAEDRVSSAEPSIMIV